jgi:hypothetical protein
MTTTHINRLATRAMRSASNTFDDEAAMSELRNLARGDEQALEQAMKTCLAWPVSLAIRDRAIELLARVRYEDPQPPA